MRFISEDTGFALESNKKEMWFNRDGKEVCGENEKFFAKTIEENGRSSYYVRTHDSLLFDPIGTHSMKKNMDVTMNKVSKGTFDFYMMYLNTKNNQYLTRAERGFLNE